MITVKTARQLGCEQGLAALDAELLLAFCLNKPRSWLYTWPEYLLSPAQADGYDQLIRRRLSGEPVAHLIGEREFWSLPLAVNSSTLIPRPDTETLVELVLERITGTSITLADLGTGTGAIALALASEQPGWTIVAIDNQPEAVRLAKANARNLGLRINVVRAHWCQTLANTSHDVLVSNPPYIDIMDKHLQEGDLRFEPHSALVAAEQGLADIRTIADQGRRVLKPDGWLFFEHGWQQGTAVRTALNSLGYCQIETAKDLGGNDRISLACWPG